MLLAVLVDLENNERPKAFIKNMNKNIVYRDKINDCYNLAFSKNSENVYYVRLNRNLRPYAVFCHKLGTRGSLIDKKVFEENEEKYFVDLNVTKCKSFFVIFSSVKETHKIYVKKRLENDDVNEKFVLINGQKEGIYSVEKTEKGFFALQKINNKTSLLYVSEKNFLNGLDKIESKNDLNYENDMIFKENFVYETLYTLDKDFTLNEIDFFNNFIVLYIISSGQNKIIKLNIKNFLTNDKKEYKSEIHLQNKFGNISPLTNNNINSSEIQFAQDTPFTYNETFNYNLLTQELEKIKNSKIGGTGGYKFNPKNYKITEKSYLSYDGTEIPLILIHNKYKNIDNPSYLSKCLVRFYGCYGVPTELGFNSNDWHYLENNWIIAFPLIRGGGDKGIKWHKSAIKENKFKSVLDIVNCFQFLIGSGLTHSGLLCASSSSAGAGLLAAAVNHSPHLLKSVILSAPFLNFIDLLSDKNLPLAESDYEEFGDPADLKEFENLFNICPYKNIKKKEYPAILLNCYKDDYRTPLWHVLKYMDKLLNCIKNPEKNKHRLNKNVFIKVKEGSHNGVILNEDISNEILDEFLFFDYFTNVMNKEIKETNYTLRVFK